MKYEVSRELKTMVEEINIKLAKESDFINQGELLSQLSKIAKKQKVWGKVKVMVKGIAKSAIDYAIKAYESYKANHKPMTKEEENDKIKSLESTNKSLFKQVLKLNDNVNSMKHNLNRIGETCSPTKINSYYKKLAKLVHPDIIGGDGQAFRLLKEFKDDITSPILVEKGF